MDYVSRSIWVHGLRVRADFGLPCLRAADAVPDLTLLTTIHKSGRPEPETVRRPEDHDQRSVGATRPLYADRNMQIAGTIDGPSVVVRYGAVGVQFTLDVSQSPIRVIAAADRDEWLEWIPVLAQGAMLAAAVELQGRAAFHANTVDVDGEGVLIGGVSGAGKTVATALLILAGNRLVADDVSVVDPELPVRPGLLEMRIRTWENAVGQMLVDELSKMPGATQRSTIDWRVAVRSGGDPDYEGVMPARIVLTVVDDDIDRPQLHTVSGSEALTALLPVKRLVGWTDPERLRADFGHCADLAGRIPVQRLVLPKLSSNDSGCIHRVADQLDQLFRHA